MKFHDGMDVCLCVFHESEKTEAGLRVSFAGAKRPLYIVKSGEQSLVEIKGDKKTIGGRQMGVHKTFTSKDIVVQKGDMLYLTTDGFPDQNNPSDQKFTLRRLKSSLIKIAHLPAHVQEKFLLEELELYQGNESQRDDITVLGIRIL
jgi:serine phosphatase RsbU (regulator of sigma subunit)